MRPIYHYLAAFLLSTVISYAKVEVIQDFEGDGFDSWQTSGTAFGLSPVDGKLEFISGEIRGYSGETLVCSSNGGYDAVGTLTSPEITLTYPYLGFLSRWEEVMRITLAVQLLVDNKVVRTATGHNGLALRRVVWDISEFKGKKGAIRIVDNAQGAWGFIAADRFVFSSSDNPLMPMGGRPKPKSDINLIPVPNEGSAAVMPGLKMSVVASHAATGVSSPTSMSIAPDGRLFVAETHRYRKGIEDDRANLTLVS
jgi:hypothetical protein